MANPLFNQYGNVPTNMGLNQLWEEAQKLKQTMQNPKAEVERLLQTGQMSQAEFNRLNEIKNNILLQAKR